MNKERIVRTVAFAIVVEFINKIFPLFIVFYVIRNLGKAAFGYAQFGIAMMEISLPFIILGYNVFGSIQVGKFRDQPERLGDVIGSIMSLKVIHGLVVLAVLALKIGRAHV